MVINFENIPIYSIFLLLSLIMSGIFVFVFSSIQKIEKNTTMCLIVYELLGVILGAKILNMIQTHNYNSIYYAGFSAYGGVIGGLVFIILFSKLYKIPLKKLFLIFIPILPLMYSVSKLGCFFNGCCYGIEYNGVLNVVYKHAIEAPSNTRLFPIQLVEALTNFAIFVYVLWIYKKKKDDENFIGKIFILCGISKFVLEFFRASWNASISTTQIISLIFIIIGIYISIKWRNYEKK